MPSQDELDAEYSGNDLEAKVRRLESTVNGLMESGLDRLLNSGILQFDAIPTRWENHGIQIANSNVNTGLWIVENLVPDPTSEPSFGYLSGGIATDLTRIVVGAYGTTSPRTAQSEISFSVSTESAQANSTYALMSVYYGGVNKGSARLNFVPNDDVARFIIGLLPGQAPTVLNLVELNSDNASPDDGDIWYYDDKLYARINGATVELGATGGGMTTPALLAAPALDKTVNLATPAAAAWTTANTAVYVPFELSDDRAVTEVIFNKGAVAGNVNVALYNEDAAGLPGARIGSALGSTAVSAGANAPQVLNITDQALSAGRYFVGIVFDTITTLTLTSWSGSAATTPLVGVYTEASAFTLPATATPVSPTGNLRIPALLVRTV